MLPRFANAVVYVYREAGCDLGLASDGWNGSLGLLRSSSDGFVFIKHRATAELGGVEMRITILYESW
jgi:hypothetical protein